jgi:hypothetical protein
MAEDRSKVHVLITESGLVIGFIGYLEVITYSGSVGVDDDTAM